MELREKEWQVIEPLLPDLPTQRRGRPWRENREVLDAILWVLRIGAPWKDLPNKYQTYQTYPRRFQQWSNDRTPEKVIQAVASKLEKHRGLNLASAVLMPSLFPPKKGSVRWQDQMWQRDKTHGNQRETRETDRSIH